MIAGGKVSEEEEEEEVEETALAAGSLKPLEGVDLERAEPDVGAKKVVSEPAEEAASAENIAGD